jgi:hypothetical protein
MTDKKHEGQNFSLTRQYGGTHLGNRRFKIHELMKQVIECMENSDVLTLSPPQSKPPLMQDDNEDENEDMEQGSQESFDQ